MTGRETTEARSVSNPRALLKARVREVDEKRLVRKRRGAYGRHPFPEAQKTLRANHIPEQGQHANTSGPEGRRDRDKEGNITDSLLRDFSVWPLFYNTSGSLLGIRK